MTQLRIASIGRVSGIVNSVSWTLLILLTMLVLAMNISITPRHWSGGPLRPSPDSHAMPEEDFANLWAAGHMARQGDLAAVYDSGGFQHWKQAAFGVDLQREDWVYPPTVLLLGVPLSFLPLLAGFLLWDGVTLFIAIALLRVAGLEWPVVLAGVGGPAAWRSLTLGQYGVLTGAMVVAGLMLSPRWPWRAGILLGLSTLKPQQGFIVPVAWLAARQGQAMLAGAVTVAALALAVGLAFGWPAWSVFFAQSGRVARHLLEAPPPQNYISDGVSVFWMLRTMGAAVTPAYAGQIFSGICAAGFCYHAWRDTAAAPLPRMALTVCLSLFITPYGFTSDMVALSVALAVVVAGRGWRLNPLDVLIWLWPAYCPLVTLQTGLLLTPIAVLLVALQAGGQINRQRLPHPI